MFAQQKYVSVKQIPNTEILSSKCIVIVVDFDFVFAGKHEQIHYKIIKGKSFYKRLFKLRL